MNAIKIKNESKKKKGLILELFLRHEKNFMNKKGRL